jgi:hypothetical protein
MKDAHTNEQLSDLDRVLLGQPISSGWPFFSRFYLVFYVWSKIRLLDIAFTQAFQI